MATHSPYCSLERSEFDGVEQRVDTAIDDDQDDGETTDPTLPVVEHLDHEHEEQYLYQRPEHHDAHTQQYGSFEGVEARIAVRTRDTRPRLLENTQK